MKIYGSYTSPFARHCRIALLQTQLTYEFIEMGAMQADNASPTKKVPYLTDGDLVLTDSSSILKYIRQQSGSEFLQDINDYEIFSVANTLMDASVNIVLLDKIDNIQIADSKYLQRQQSRVLSGLEMLNNRQLATELPLSDGQIRLACFLDFGIYREVIDLSSYQNLQQFLELAQTDPNFLNTAPPVGG